MSAGLILFAYGLVALMAYKIYGFQKYARQAMKTGLPWTWTPMLETESVSLLLTFAIRWYYREHIRAGNTWPSWCRFIVKDWQWEDKRRAHDLYGDVFLVVSPEGMICYIADAITSYDVCARRNDFGKPQDKYKIVEPYGPNLVSAEGNQYRMHLRIAAPSFTDASGANELVWKITTTNTERLCEAWATEGTDDVQGDLNMITLATICAAVFGRKVSWEQRENQKPAPGHKLPILKALGDVTVYMVHILLMPNWLLRLVGKSDAALAKEELDSYMQEMIKEEEDAIAKDMTYENPNARGNLLTSMVKTNAEEMELQKQGKTDKGHKREIFTNEQLMGNLFIFLLGGYETTANALTYAMIMMAAQPELQEPLIAEIKRVDEEAKAAGRDELTFHDDYNKYHQILALVWESFRCFPGVALITKMTREGNWIDVGCQEHGDGTGKRHYLPPGCRTYLNVPAIQYNDKYWPDADQFRSERWLRDDGNGNQVFTYNKEFPAKGTMMTFSDGSRACIGRKISTSEFVTFVATVLRNYRVKLGPKEDPKDVKERLFRMSAGKVTTSLLGEVSLSLERHSE